MVCKRWQALLASPTAQ
ncbi:hypothetical protein HaLaN_19746 [Haematococcus lacustris]|uniref:Uncharacterized protein n=1 Tax=Haematococcus lacustris TaxID=44745 RepID=A0A699ZRH7_HAELA|nr:hypothetical protein HaLaN_19746 [Haematococcus lacustris]